MKIESWKLYHFYLALVSFISLIAVAITLWIVFTGIGKFYIISDEEYLQFRESWKLEGCKTATYPTTNAQPVDGKEVVPVSPTEEEITKCEEKVRQEVSFSRKYDFKYTFITSTAWFIIFLILFIFHYPKFLKSKEQN